MLLVDDICGRGCGLDVDGTLRAGVLVWVPRLMVVEEAWVPNAGYLYGVVEQRGP